MPMLERDGEIFVLQLEPDDENRFHPDWLAAVEAALDEAEAGLAEDGADPRALITAGRGKFWTNGLDLDWMAAHPDQAGAYLGRVQALLARTLASPVVTVAALNGHAFGAGAMWALAHDLRVMRTDRGWFCLPEVDMGLSFAPGMAALIQARLAPATAHEAMTTGRRYGGEQALAAGIVEMATSADRLLTVATELARPLAAKSKPARAQIKETMYAQALSLLRT
jgi:enoyl-CoA hydratase/carnithine racemase